MAEIKIGLLCLVGELSRNLQVTDSAYDLQLVNSSCLHTDRSCKHVDIWLTFTIRDDFNRFFPTAAM